MFGRNSFSSQRSLSTHLKLVHTLKKWLCGFSSNNFLLLDYFDVGDCGTGLFWGGRFYCWTFLLWEILMLDFLASGQMNRQAFESRPKMHKHWNIWQNNVKLPWYPLWRALKAFIIEFTNPKWGNFFQRRSPQPQSSSNIPKLNWTATIEKIAWKKGYLSCSSHVNNQS